MKHHLRFEIEAAAELEDAALWYDHQHPGLGSEFLAAIDATIVSIDRWPEAAPAVLGLPADLPVRSAVVRRFPYRIAYLITDDAIRVLAIAHSRRRPRYWHRRAAAPPDAGDNP